MKVQVLVEVFQLIIDDVKIFMDFDEAKAEFKRYTHMDYDEYSQKLEADPDATPEGLIGDTEGTQIFEIEFTPKGIQICEYENIHCPYCGGSNLKDSGKTTLNQHELNCLECAGTFWIPCED